MKSDEEVIEDMIETLQAEKGWCKGAMFVDEDGRSVSTMAYAQSQCLLGALQRHTTGLYKVLGEEAPDEVTQQEARLHRRITMTVRAFVEHNEEFPCPEDCDRNGLQHKLKHGFSSLSIPGFNDRKETTKEDVILMLKHAREQDLLSEPSDSA